MEKLPIRDYWPTNAWQYASPAKVGLHPMSLAHLQSYIATYLPGLLSLLIVQDSYLISETYYHGFHEHSYFSLASATKSITSALVGRAMARGELSNLEQPILDFFPEQAARETDPRKFAVTLRHLLSLTAGFARDFPREYWLNPVQKALERPMRETPGTSFYYDSQAVDILPAIIAQVSGQSAAAYANATLFKELGIWQAPNARFTWRDDPEGKHTWHGDALWDEHDGYLWKVDPQGYQTGAFGLHLTAREMAKIGFLYLNGGVWNGQQLIPDWYVTASTRAQSSGGPPVKLPYGYLWWIASGSFLASGFGGKLIYVVPKLDLVVVTTSSNEEARRDPAQSQKILDLITNFVRSLLTEK